MKRQIEIIHSHRRTGNTEWLLKSAIKNPNVTIICRDESNVRILRERYYHMLSGYNWITRKWWSVFGRKHPKFISIHNAGRKLRGTGDPIAFDNSAIY